MDVKRIGILGYEGVAELGFIGPLQAFASASRSIRASHSTVGYELSTIALNAVQFTSESGVVLHAQHTADTTPELDTLIIPGGSGLRETGISGPVADWIALRVANTRRVVSICTGIYGVAPTGLLDYRRVTTHWRFVRDVERRFPKLHVAENSLFLQDGKFYTSAGGTAGIDLSLALIEQDFGADVALDVARELLVYLRRDGGQEQYAEPSPLQVVANPEFAALAQWIEAHLGEDLRLERLAARVALGKVYFIRHFRSAFGVTPGVFIKTRRLNEARRRLLSGESTASVAEAVGFRSALYFAQEFKWRFGAGPDEYQSRFRLTSSCSGSVESPRQTTVAHQQHHGLSGSRWSRRRAASGRANDLVLDAA